MTSPAPPPPPSSPAATASTRPLAPDPWETSKALHAVYQHPFRYTVSPAGCSPGRASAAAFGGASRSKTPPPGRLRGLPRGVRPGGGRPLPVDDAFNAARRCAWDYREATERLRVDGHGRGAVTAPHAREDPHAEGAPPPRSGRSRRTSAPALRGHPSARSGKARTTRWSYRSPASAAAPSWSTSSGASPALGGEVLFVRRRERQALDHEGVPALVRRSRGRR